MRRTLVMLLVVSATAQAQPEDTDERARTLFAEGRRAYAEARYDDALVLFEQSHALSGRVGLLYNIGLTLERLRRDEDLQAPFEEYLRSNPPAERRAEVQRRLAEARARLEPPPRPSPAPWIVAAAGVAVAVVGAALWAVGARDVADIEGSDEGTEWSDVSGDASRARALSIVGISLVGVGVGVGVLGVTLGVTRDDDATMEASLTWRGRF